MGKKASLSHWCYITLHFQSGLSRKLQGPLWQKKYQPQLQNNVMGRQSNRRIFGFWRNIANDRADAMGIGNIRSQDYSFPRHFVPTMKLSFSRPFVPGNIRSLDHSFHGTFVPKKEWALEHKFPGLDLSTLGNFLFLYHKRKSAVQNGQLYFYVNTHKHLMRIIGLDLRHQHNN